MPADLYAESYVDLPVARSWAPPAPRPASSNRPRGIAVGPGGEVYVVDSDNARVQVFSPDGTFLRQWGSYCAMDTGSGCLDPDGSGPLALGDGQFNEPWGITVDGDANGGAIRVYVADTWNHRIQVFDGDGAFVVKWGTLGQLPSASGGEELFYGPRDLVVDSQGRLFVSDTGNKRIMVLSLMGPTWPSGWRWPESPAALKSRSG